MVDRRLGSDYSQEQALRLLNVALLCTSTQPTQRPKMSSVVKMLRGEIPIETVPADDDVSEDLRLNIAQSQDSISNSQTNWSQHSVNNSRTNWSETPSSDPSVLPHSSKDSGYLPSSSSFSVKLWASASRIASQVGRWCIGVGIFGVPDAAVELYIGKYWVSCLRCNYLTFHLDCQLSFKNIAHNPWQLISTDVSNILASSLFCCFGANHFLKKKRTK